MRELSHSYYHAENYEYPITFVRLPDGSDGIAHCPRSYSRIDIEAAESGHCLTDHVERTSADVFHSRLVQSPSGGWLAAAGWVWHPCGVTDNWSLPEVLRDPTLLDSEPIWLGSRANVDIDSVLFMDERQLLVATVADQDTDGVGDRLWTLDPHSHAVEAELQLPGTMGAMHRLGERGLLGLFSHPRLHDAATGQVVRAWPHLQTGTQRGSIVIGQGVKRTPPIAVHPTEPWFAVAGNAAITVVQLAK